MKKFLNLLLALSVSYMVGAPAFARNIYGKDNREIVLNTKSIPFQMIGKIETYVVVTPAHIFPPKIGKAACTGTLVGPDLVLTNFHCIEHLALHGHGLAHFYPGYTRGKQLLEGESTEFFAHYNINVEKKIFSYNDHQDWAILKLKSPLGNSLGWIDIAPSAEIKKGALQNFLENWKIAAVAPYLVTLPGYSGDVESGEVLTVHRNCQIHKLSEYFMHHDCDMASGSSGSPILRQKADGKYEIVGLNTGQFGPGVKVQGQILAFEFPEYDPKYPNVGISSRSFYSDVQTLLKESLQKYK